MSWSAESMDEMINQDSVGEETLPENGKHLAMERDFEEISRSEGVVDGSDVEKAYPDLNNLTVRKVPHQNLVLHDIATHCGHCGHKLTDAVSVQRSIGPQCSKRGYSEDPVDGDEIQAMIDLAEFPELVEFLTEHYKPLGIRGLVNGLVRVASLNRPRGRNWCDGNDKVFSACADSIESLGHKKMAELLRETLIIIVVSEPDAFDSHVKVWVKKRDWTKYWSWDIKKIPGAYFSKQEKGNLVPKTQKRALWELMKRRYPGAICQTPNGVVKIPTGLS